MNIFKNKFAILCSIYNHRQASPEPLANYSVVIVSKGGNLHSPHPIMHHNPTSCKGRQ